MHDLFSYPLTAWTSASLTCAAAAPWLTRKLGKWAPVGFGLLTLGQFIYFCTEAPKILAGVSISERFNWINEPNIEWALRLDGLSLLFALLISGIGFVIVAYSSRYLNGHPQLGRFYATLFLFMASMFGIVLSDNLIVTFIFWELTSISSYFLIGFDHEREEARNAALQALLVTGFGGLAMLGGFILLADAGGGFQISTLLEKGEELRAHPFYVPILILISLGAFTKSAQFPFHFWLPNAMQAPTPVSAYLHSATMVKAGVFLLARLSPALGGTQLWIWLLSGVGMATMLTGATASLAQKDLKLILAYLTVAVLGLLTLLLGIGTPVAIIAFTTYLLVHSLYKGSLFLIAGNIDHETGTRNISVLAGLSGKMQFTATAAVLGALSMAGFPFLFGFIGKELIFETLWTGVQFGSSEAGELSYLSLTLLLGTIATMIVAVSFSLVLGYRILFIGRHLKQPIEAHEAPGWMWICPLILSFIGLVLGLAPGLAENTIQAAASSIRGSKTEVQLSIWHGFNPPLFFSILSAGVGLILYLRLENAAAFTRRFQLFSKSVHPSRLYSISLSTLHWVARWQANLLQRGGVRRYLFYAISFVTAMTGYSYLHLQKVSLPHEWSDVRYYEGMLCALIVSGAVTASLAQSPLAAVAALGVSGYAIALIYVIFGAPDLAMTQFLVETLTVILLALVLSKLPSYTKRRKPFSKIAAEVGVASIFGILMTVLTWRVLQDPLDWTLSEYFATKSLSEGHGRNIVNVILVDFRALDTLGEISVLGLAGLGVYGLVRLKPYKTEKKRQNP